METDPVKFKGISEGLLSDGFDVRISTRGMSMYPLVSTGDKITVRPDSPYRIGDLIVFKRDGQMVCHRLLSMLERDGTRYYQTQGDSFFGLDEPVTEDQVLGRVIRIERGKISAARRVLLLLSPVLRYGRLNAWVVSALMKITRKLSARSKG